jgi:hypothetical protein
MKYMKTNKTGVLALLVGMLGLWSCHKDLDRFPTNDITSEVVYKDINGYIGVASKVYGSMALTGSFGPGSTDLAGIDPGTSDFLRLWWKAQTLSTDEAVVAWNDPGIQDFHNMNWSSSNPMLRGLYNRCIYIITAANEFLRESTPAKLSARGITGADATLVNTFRAEMRFIRAFNYWVLMDLFGNPPFVTEEDQIGLKPPRQIKRADLFKYVEEELLAIQEQLGAPRTLPYGRADRAAAWALLSRLYLNAHIYNGGTTRYNDCIAYSRRVIDAGYSLNPSYAQLFLADNHLNTNENIFTLRYDGLNTQNFGGTTFIIHAQIVNGMSASQFGVNGGWSGIRATKALPDKFPDPTGNSDSRAMFFTGNPAEIEAVSDAAQGWPSTKFKNVTRTGAPGSDPSGTFVDTDFPLFRLAEMYLNYAEAVLRGGTGGSTAQALAYINLLRERAYGNNSGNFTSITLNDILDERSREMHWEGLRRTDLIRYGYFTSSSYLWPWKGGLRNGTGVGAHRNLYPLPAPDLSANPNLTQNPNY